MKQAEENQVLGNVDRIAKEDSNRWRLLTVFLPHLLLIGCPLLLFGRMMIGETVPGFRDSVFFYFPMFQWIDAQWAAGEFPFWNPQDNFGTPVIEDGSTSLFYPLKAVFCARFLSYCSRFGIYLYVHFLLAAYGAFFCARLMRANMWGATLAGLSFALSGSVLFQVCNIIFLVSSAWLPWALACWWRLYLVSLVPTRSNKNALLWISTTAVCLAMMVLAGDPQMAYHGAMLGFAICFLSWWCQDRNEQRVNLRWNIVKYVAVGCISVVLCCVQLWPTADYSRLSQRTREPGQTPRSLLDAASYLTESNPNKNFSEVTKGLFGAPEADTHSAYVYEFSQPWWSVLQLVWPNYNGKFMPKYERWTLPFEKEKIWTVSIFMGIVPVFFAFTGLTFPLKNHISIGGGLRTNAFLSWVILFFGIASIGAIGVLYWLMVVILPGYNSFRYPAKLFVIVALAISLLAARQFNPRVLLRSIWLPRLAGFLISGTLLVGIYANIPTQEGMGHFAFYDLISEIYASQARGPFNPLGCYVTVMTSLVTAIVTGGLMLWFFGRVRRGRLGIRATMVLLTCLLAAELLWSNAWMILPMPSDALTAEVDNPVRPGQRWGRCFEVGFPDRWIEESSDDRLAEMAVWQRQTLFPRFNLGESYGLVGASATIVQSWSKLEFPDEVKSTLQESGDWAAWLLTSNDPAIDKTVDGICFDSVVYENPNNIERKRIPVSLPEQFENWVLVKRTEDGKEFYRNPKRPVATNESPLPTVAAWDGEGRDFVAGYVKTNSIEVVYSVDDSTVSQQFFLTSAWAPGWRAIANSKSDGLFEPTQLALEPHSPSTTRIDCSSLPAGEYSIQLTYQPRGFWFVFWISAIGWVLVSLNFVVTLVKRLFRRFIRG